MSLVLPKFDMPRWLISMGGPHFSEEKERRRMGARECGENEQGGGEGGIFLILVLLFGFGPKQNRKLKNGNS